jgi:hypothetical protein
MTEGTGPFAGVAPKPGWVTVVLLDVPGRRGPLRFTAPVAAALRPSDPAAAQRIARILAADRTARAVIRRLARCPPPVLHSTAILGYIPRPRRPGALRINELGALLRLRWAEAGWPWLEVPPLWLARFVSDADEGSAAAVWAELDAGQGMPGGSGGYGWAAALAHVARCAALPEEYAPWRAELAQELARWG